jgi:Antitoxin Xre/MbcA/ParS C-terminal toxin-binding domain
VALGNGQDQFRVWGLDPRLGRAAPELGGREAEAGVDSLTSLWDTAERMTGSEFLRRPLAATVEVRPHTEAIRSLSFFYEMPISRSDEERSGSREIITLGVASAETSPYRGRITGPVKFINQLLATWQLTADSACILLGFEPSDSAYIHNVLRGYTTLRGRDAKDRIAHLLQIRMSLSALFRDEAVENEWLREPQDILNGKTPMELLLEGSMENLLLVKEYVELVAGR